MAKRHSNESFIASAKLVHGGKYDYSRVTYVAQNTHILVTCSIHGAFSITPKKHLSGSGCRKCAAELLRKPLDSFIAAARNVHGTRYGYEKVDYKNINARVTVMCPVHGAFEQVAKIHLNGSGCPKCAGVNRKTNDVFIKEAKAVHGDTYDYTGSNYVSAKTKVRILCTVHGAFEQRPTAHLRGQGCPKCAKVDKPKEAAMIRLERIKLAIANKSTGASYDFQDAANVHDRVHITCGKGHTYEQRVDGAIKYGCPVCSKRQSTGEIEMRAYIESLGFTVVRTRKVAPPTEIDAWVPEKNIGFEYNGLYYHSDAFDGAKWRHFNKSAAVRAAGGRLVHIWADDWVYRRTATETMIAAQLGKLECLHARTTAVRLLDASEAKSLLNTYHLQGYTPAMYYGLEHNGEVVAAMGFSTARSIRGNTDDGLVELVRFVAKKRIVGGASKLLSAWKREVKNWHTLITYCDHAQFDGGLYESIGFTKVQTKGPDYKVILAGGDTRVHKSNVRKARLKTLLGNKYDETKSESDLCTENHIYRVWDCGKTRYELNNTQPSPA
jgi:hypothetical protein